MFSFVSLRDDLTGGVYGPRETGGVTSLILAGSFSGFAVLLTFAAVSLRSPIYHGTHVIPYLVCLLTANILQAVGSIMNAKWIVDGVVEAGSFCTVQGSIKQAGNVGTAFWSFTLSTYIFFLLFLRWKSTNSSLWITLCSGWFLVLFVVCIGPIAIQTADKGPYFGPTGYWCWITSHYPKEQTYLEYFFEWLSAGLSFILYTAIVLRVRGNMIVIGGQWHLRFVPRGESWQLAFGRDSLDTSMMRVATRIMWFPIAYGILVIPISLARLIQFSGHEVPFWATILADTIFNLQGLVNVILLLSTRRLIPDPATLPVFSTPRKLFQLHSSEVNGITPFILPPKEGQVASNRESPSFTEISRSITNSTTISAESVTSQTSLHP